MEQTTTRRSTAVAQISSWLSAQLEVLKTRVDASQRAVEADATMDPRHAQRAHLGDEEVLPAVIQHVRAKRGVAQRRPHGDPYQIAPAMFGSIYGRFAEREVPLHD